MQTGYYETKKEYSKEYKESCWNAAIGLQQVDGLTVSDYLRELSYKEIDGKLTHYEIEELLYKKYEDENIIVGRQKEADIVSTRIAALLQEDGFTLSPVMLKHIHKSLFVGIYSQAGEFRKYNISKDEPILGGRSVKYANYQMIEETFAYDFEQEKRKSYAGLSKDDVIKRITEFTSAIWQVHAFGEGNTRTTAVFIQKYLNFMGFGVDNSLFLENSLFYRNALVRSNFGSYSEGVLPTNKWLEYFYENLLFAGEHELRNRELLVEEYMEDIRKLVKEDVIYGGVKIE
ncbi:MAG: Fic family protein [Agathobacter sp.]|nr:Fic family protein [Agathobacter sp.]